MADDASIRPARDLSIPRHDWTLEEVEALFAAIDGAVRTPITDVAPRIAPPATGIVVLGYALKKDGTMDAPLIQRLEKTLEVARALPAAPIVVTGGAPKAGKTEAAAMKQAA